ncbi:hypothetical protein NPIL_165111 [Nephila pilipes]|uniref:Uncharacterized protein n=1 Tax=Nephila pilipes TaxID=299642 RepID=A0A8X6PM37_NEPPI|nr:hypothetical protein NPIL_165111 [Nephila pilipes]
MRSRAGSLTVGGGIVDAYCSCIPSISSLLSICVACRSFLSIAFSLLPHNRAIIYHFRMTFIVAVNPFLFSREIYSTPTAWEIGSISRNNSISLEYIGSS